MCVWTSCLAQLLQISWGMSAKLCMVNSQSYLDRIGNPNFDHGLSFFMKALIFVLNILQFIRSLTKVGDYVYAEKGIIAQESKEGHNSTKELVQELRNKSHNQELIIIMIKYM